MHRIETEILPSVYIPQASSKVASHFKNLSLTHILIEIENRWARATSWWSNIHLNVRMATRCPNWAIISSSAYSSTPSATHLCSISLLVRVLRRLAVLHIHTSRSFVDASDECSVLGEGCALAVRNRSGSKETT